MSKINSGWVRKQTTVLLSMTLALAPVAATPALAADAEGGSDVILEQSVETEGEKDPQQSETNVESEKNVEQEDEIGEGEQQASPKDDATGSESTSLMSAPSSSDTTPVVEQRASTVVTMTQGDGQAVEYENLAAALADVEPYDYKTNKDAYTIALAQNVTEDVTSPAGVNVTIDLAGHTLTNASGHTITNRSTKTVIADSVGGGVVDNVSHGRAAVYNDINASITLKGGTFSRSAEASTGANGAGGNSWYVLKNFGSMTINDGVTVKFSDDNPGYYSSLIGNGWQNSAAAETGNSEPKPSDGKNKATLTINGGNFVGGKITVKNDDYGVLTVKGGSISQDTDSYYAIYNANKATISGGTISASSDAIGSEHYDGAANDGSLTVSGGTITSKSGSAIALLGGAEGTIKGGTFQGGSGQYVIDVDGSSSAVISKSICWSSPTWARSSRMMSTRPSRTGCPSGS